MSLRMISILFLALLSPVAAGRQPATAKGATEASEKLAPKTTPMAMVIKLLKDLTIKVENQGKEEAAQYDKFACFCKEQADEKLYATESSEKKIEELTAALAAYNGEIADLVADITKLGQDIVDLEDGITTLDENRTAEHKTYEGNAAEMVAAIDACERAIEALKESKALMEGKANTETPAFQQVHAAASEGSKKGFVVLTAEQESALNELAHSHAAHGRGPTDGEAYSSKYHSNEVIELLDDLKNQFIKQKNDLDTDEFESKEWYQDSRMQKENEKKFKGLDKEEKERQNAVLEAKKEQAEEDKYVEARSKKADDEFMGVLQTQCQDKAEAWDLRSKTNAEELQALAAATEALESGAAPNWKSNKKLNDFLQTHKAARHAAASFLQLRGASPKKQEMKRQKVMALLSSTSEKIHSSILAMVSLRVQASDDPFVKVRGLMKDLITRLEADAATELQKKGLCDTKISQFVGDRDDAASTMEKNSKDKAAKEAESTQLTMEIAKLAKDIAANKKYIMEETQLRSEESASNAKTLSEAEAGLAAVKKAIAILEDFYNNVFFLQVQQSGKTGAPTPPPKTREDELRFKSENSDREGNTVGDLAPETFTNDDYKGQQEASKGIIGTLQVIEADFQRTVDTTDEQEKADQLEHDTLMADQNTLLDQEESDKTKKNGELTIASEAILSLGNDLSDSTEAHTIAEKELDALRAGCVEPEETYEERVAKRNQEIEALKEAHNILEDWESQ